MILADVEGRDHMSPKKRSLFEMMGDNYLTELEDGRLAHSMESVEDLFETKREGSKKSKKQKAELTPEQEAELKDTVGNENFNLALDIASFVVDIIAAGFAAPTGGVSLVVAAIPHIVNGIRKVNDGNYIDGVFDIICAIPGIGEGAVVIKGINKTAKVAKLIEIGKNGKKALLFIRRIINKYVTSSLKSSANSVIDAILSGAEDRIKRAIHWDSAGETVPPPEPQPKKSGGLTYLNSLAQEELAQEELAQKESSKKVAESKRPSRLSLVGTLYSN